ncbi:MAG: Uncharacterized protein SCO3347, partial [uncultured Nocardioides sp.]
APADRALHRLGLSRVDRARLRLGGEPGVRRGRGDGRHRRAEPAGLGGQAAQRPPRHAGLRGPRADAALHAAGVGHRPVGQARAVGRDGGGGGRRRRRRAPALPLAEGVRRGLRRRDRGARVLDRDRLRRGEHVPLARLLAARHGDVPPALGPLHRGLRPHGHRPVPRRDRRQRRGRDGGADGRPAAPRPPHRRHRVGQGRAPRAGPGRHGRRAVPGPPRQHRLRRPRGARDQHPAVHHPRGTREGPAGVPRVRPHAPRGGPLV